MNLLHSISLFTPLDAIAVAIWALSWLLIGLMIENPPNSRPSVSTLMLAYRHAWMQEMVTRQPRMFDSQILSSLRQGTTFFASGSMLAIGGGLALIGNAERLLGLARDLTLNTAPAVVWEIKILAVLLLVTNAFLKFVWAHRLFGYCAVVMASVPNEPDDPKARPRARKAADLSNTAARSFNRGMRSLYFALGGLAWLVGATPLIVAALVTLFVLLRREFASQSRLSLMQVET
ncbi:DUF599 domain-containing protein [Actibacterium sp. XHP0104]|uniref:DUF599 domain-containing protein n=1 Tax=Actibacterium sp. XHP0104 TaxID=2984335 RepID=UPI0021E786D2|nr:DUF599 domain-containing protein [Actibacterium sp. XHP0104]MCV2882324.1 DUF599 domain-containing protein [Actibacterium sp. XHP0104]